MMTVDGTKPSSRFRIGVIIVHYKTPQMLLDCLESLQPEIDPQHDVVVVVDNASGEEQISPLRRTSVGSLPMNLIESPTNLGFAGANNLGIQDLEKRGGCDFYMLLNPDTIVLPGAFATLLNFLKTTPQAACVGPRLEYPDATPQVSAFGDPTPISEFVRGANIGLFSRLLKRWEVYGEVQSQSHVCEWLAGACVLMRREVIEKIGMLDDRYFMYFEEVDFFRRARKAGLSCWYEPAAHVVHLVGQSSGVTTNWEAKRLPAYWFESRHRYFRKHFGYFGMMAADVAWMTGHALMRVRKLFTGVSHSAVARKEPTDLLFHSWRQMKRPFDSRKEAQPA